MENVAQENEKAISGAIKIDEKEIRTHLDGLVRQSLVYFAHIDFCAIMGYFDGIGANYRKFDCLEEVCSCVTLI